MVIDVAISPDGNTALLGSIGYVTVINLNDFSSRQIFIGAENGSIENLFFLPDSQSFIAGSTFDPPVLVNVLTGEIIQTFDGLDANPLALSPDGTKLAGTQGYRSIEIWDIATNQRLVTMAYEGLTTSLNFSPDGERLLSTGDDILIPTAWVWDVETGQEIMKLPHEEGVEAAAFSRDGQYIATGDKLWDAATGEAINDLNVLWGYAFVEFSPDSKLLVVVDGGGSATVVDIATWEPLFQTVIGSNHNNLVTFSPDGQNLLLGSRLLDVRSGALVANLGGHSLFNSVNTLSADGKRAVTAGSDYDVKGDGLTYATIIVWDVDAGTIINTFVNDDRYNEFYSVALSPDATKLLASDSDFLRMWDIATGNVLHTIENPANNVLVGFSKDGTRFFETTHEGDLVLYDVATGDILQRYDHGEAQITAVSISPDGKTAVTGSKTVGNAFIRLWNVETGEMLSEQQLGISTQIDAAVFSPDGSQFISLENKTSGDDPTILRIWDTDSGQETNTVTMSAQSSSAAYFPDGRQLLVGAVIVDTVTGNILDRLTEREADHVTVSANGERVLLTVSANGDRVVVGASSPALIYEKVPFAPLTDDSVSQIDESTSPETVAETETEAGSSISDSDSITFTLGADLYQQVNYFGMFDFFFEGISCADMVYEGIEIDMEYNLGAYQALSGNTEPTPTLYDSIEIRSCEWQVGDEINVQLTLPSGETIVKEITYGDAAPLPSRADRINEMFYAEDEFDDGALALYFVPGFDSEPGDYLLDIEGNGRSLAYPFTVTAPNQPRVFDEGDDDSSAWLLSQFAPGEQVRLVAYGNTNCNWDEMYEVELGYVPLCLMTVLPYTVSENGRLLIEINHIDGFIYYAIVGEQSGTFALNTIVNAEVAQADARVRADWVPHLYETNAKTTVIGRLSPDVPLRIIGEQADQALVQLPDGREGWTSLAAIERGETAVSPPANTLYQSDGSDLSAWVYLPMGSYFYMGSDSFSAEFTEEAEQPTHFVSLTPFWIQRTEVSNAAYAECVAAEACSEPTSLVSNTRLDYYTNAEFAEYPVIFVTQPQAQAYCEWVGERLPTEAEWEYAARYPTHTYYTWGSAANTAVDNPDLANFGKTIGDTTPVYSHFAGITESGLFNMNGNVWEWTADWFDPDYYQNSPPENPTGPESGSEKVARGGSWSTSLEYISLTNRFNRDPNQGYDNVGFRCVRRTSP